MSATCATCRWWDRSNHAIGDCLARGGEHITQATFSCGLWQTPTDGDPAPPSSVHLVIPDSEGGTRISLKLWRALPDWLKGRR